MNILYRLFVFHSDGQIRMLEECVNGALEQHNSLAAENDK
jgi:hypothetical protein